MKTLAAVLVEPARPLELLDLDIPALLPGQALVEVAVSGVCHTQLLEVRGLRGEDRYVPHCLGHEASGTVLEVGPGVARVRPGERVVLSWLKAATGGDVPGVSYSHHGRTVNAGGVTTFQRLAVVSENRITALRGDLAGLSMQQAALIGCALPTGLGSVFNVARVMPGQSVAVIGCGGVGLSAVAGAVVSGCVPVIALDLLEARLEAARRLGAAHGVRVDPGDPAGAVRRAMELAGGPGMEACIEATGSPTAMRCAVEMVRPRGGTVVVIGNAAHGRELSIDPRHFNLGKRVLGTWGGDTEPDRDFPRIARLLAAGRLDHRVLCGPSYRLADINQALDDLEHGRSIRPMIEIAG